MSDPVDLSVCPYECHIVWTVIENYISIRKNKYSNVVPFQDYFGLIEVSEFP